MFIKNFYFVLLILCSIDIFGQGRPCPGSTSGEIETFVKKLFTPIHCPECSSLKTKCKVAQIDNLPDLIFIGEDHENLNSAAIKKELFALAERGEILLVTEVALNSPALSSVNSSYLSILNPGMESKNIYQIESELPTAVSYAYQIQNSLIEFGHSVSLFSTLVQNVIHFPIFRDALEEIRREKSFMTSLKSADLLIKWLEKSAKSKTLNVKEAMEIQKNLSQKEVPKEFYNTIHRKVIDIANRGSPNRLLGIKLPYYLAREDSSVIGLKPGINSEFEPTKILGKLLIDVRNRDFAESIGNVICDSSFKSNRIVILLGDAHVSEVKRLLTGLSGGTIRTREFQSFLPNQNEILRTTILEK